MTEAMPFLQKAILLSYDPRPLPGDIYWRRIGMIKPPVQLGVDKKYFSEEKEPPVLE